MRSANQHSMRLHNLELVLSLVLANRQGISRADIARATGLTRSTSSRLVQELLDLQLVAEQDTQGRGEPGRPMTPITPAAGTYAGLGATVNVDYACVRAIDLAGEIVFERFTPGDYRDSDHVAVLQNMGEQLSEAAEFCRVSGIAVVGAGLGLPGIVDQRGTDGVLQFAPNLGWRHIVPATYLGKQLRQDMKITVGNDANLQAIAAAFEAPGCSRGFRDFLYVSGDIGVGGALVLDGELYHGAHGWAGEIGHTVVVPDGLHCHCGAQGCLEMYVGKRALYVAAGLDPAAPALVLEEALEAGEPKALKALDAAGRMLGLAVSNVLNLLDVPTVVLGTGLGRVAEWLRPEIMDVLDVRLISRGNVQIELVAAHADSAPAATGAAYLALGDSLAHAVAMVGP